MESLTLALTLLVAATLPLGWLSCRAARHSSLVPAARWDTLTLLAVGLAELAIVAADNPQAAWEAPLRWTAASTCFCGWMARLGARRPHQAPWQFVVLTLWGILALPAAEVFLLQRGQAFEVHAARGWFLWILIGGGLANAVPTRVWVGGLLNAASQSLLFCENLPGLRTAIEIGNLRGGIVAVALTLLMLGQVCRTFSELVRKQRPGLSGVWLDFRDQFGSWWAVRLFDRVNATARQEQWPTRLTWSGFRRVEPMTGVVADSPDSGRPSPEDLPSDQLHALRQTAWNMLRRFVSVTWVAGRLGDIPEDD